MKNQLSIATSFLRGIDPLSDLEIFRRAGYTRLSADFWQYSAPDKMLSQDDWRERVSKFKEKADTLGIVFPQTHGNTLSGKQWGDPNFAEGEAHTWALNHRALEASKMLGAEWVVMHPYNLPHDRLYHRQKALDVNLSYLAPFIEQAKALGIGIALENMVDFGGNRRRYCGGDPDELLELVTVINDPAVGICIDTGHAHLSGMHVGELIRMTGDLLKCTHIDDNRADKDTHLPPYFGTIDWADTLQAMRDIDYKGDFSFELSRQHFPTDTYDTWCKFTYELGIDMLK